MTRVILAPCVLLLCTLLSGGCATTRPLTQIDANPVETELASAMRFEDATVAHAKEVIDRKETPCETGLASFYHAMFNGRKTANGEIYDGRKMTAASLTLKFGTRVLVTNLENGKHVLVRINDRGPYVSGRIIDLTHRAASVLGFVNDGTTRVRVEPIS